MKKLISICMLIITLLISTITALATDEIGISIKKKITQAPFDYILFISLASLVIAIIFLYFTLRQVRKMEQPREHVPLEEPIKEQRPKRKITIEDETPFELQIKEDAKLSSKSQDKKMDKFLTEDEIIILNVLRLKEGQCSQGTLAIATNFSKAKLSRHLAELENRGIILKIKKGKKNLVTLSE